MSASSAHLFCRDAHLPHVEVRDVREARDIGYARHSHDSFSIGIVTGGRSTYLHERGCDEVGAGAVVIMNPGAMHACNPADSQSWSYRMVHLDAAWLCGIQCELGVDAAGDLREFDVTSTRDAALYGRVATLCDRFADPHCDELARHEAIVELTVAMHERLPGRPLATRSTAPGLVRAAEYITTNCAQPISLAELCKVSGLSESHLVRSFKKRFGLTPHEFLIDRRIQRSRRELRRGRPIAEVALELGFADQAHLQRLFKRIVATTPGQYRRSNASLLSPAASRRR
jgi:AraC-like DNA-binding protein